MIVGDLAIGNLRIGPAFKLKHTTGRDDVDQPPQVVAVLDEIVSQNHQRLGQIAFVQRQVVDRIDQRPTEQQRPKAIDRRPGEGLVLRMGNPLGQPLA